MQVIRGDVRRELVGLAVQGELSLGDPVGKAARRAAEVLITFRLVPRDVVETDLDYNSTFGTLFRATRDNARRSAPVGGGNLPEAGMVTPRTLFFSRPNNADPRALHLASSGQSATRIVELSRTPSAASVLLPGESDNPESPYFDDQTRLTAPKRAFFRDRKELERAATSRKRLIF